MILTFTMMGVAMTGLALTPSYSRGGNTCPYFGGRLPPAPRLFARRRGGSEHCLSDGSRSSGPSGFIHFAELCFGRFCSARSGFGGLWALVGAQRSAAEILGLARRFPARGDNRSLWPAFAPDACRNATPGTGRRSFRRSRPVVLLASAGLLIIAGATISNYTLDYLTTYAQSTLHMAVPTAFAATVILGFIGVVGDLTGDFVGSVRAKARAHPSMGAADRLDRASLRDPQRHANSNGLASIDGYPDGVSHPRLVAGDDPFSRRHCPHAFGLEGSGSSTRSRSPCSAGPPSSSRRC